MSRLFSSRVINEIAKYGHSTTGSRLFYGLGIESHTVGNISLAEFYDELFTHLFRHYRYEYIYKNALAEKILIGKYGTKNATMLSEFRVENCIADIVLLNGSSHAFEIKSEMDSLDRIERQINAYSSVFDKITIVTHLKNFARIEKIIPDHVGISVLDDSRYRIKKKPHRDAASNLSSVSSLAILNVLHRTEYIKIIKHHFHEDISAIPNTLSYSTAAGYFSQIPPRVAHEHMVLALKKRKTASVISDALGNLPTSLKAAALKLSRSKKDIPRLIEALSRDIKTVFL